MEVESEIQSLRSKVGQLEATVAFLQKEFTEKMSLVMQRFFSHRADQIAQHKSALEEEEDMCRNLIASCTITAPPPQPAAGAPKDRPVPAKGKKHVPITQSCSSTSKQVKTKTLQTVSNSRSIASNSNENEVNSDFERGGPSEEESDPGEVDPLSFDFEDEHVLGIKMEVDEGLLEEKGLEEMENEETRRVRRENRTIHEKQLEFVRLLAQYPAVLDTSNKTEDKIAKKRAVGEMLRLLRRHHVARDVDEGGRNVWPITVKALRKKINNMGFQCGAWEQKAATGVATREPAPWMSEFIELRSKTKRR